MTRMREQEGRTPIKEEVEDHPMDRVAIFEKVITDIICKFMCHHPFLPIRQEESPTKGKWKVRRDPAGRERPRRDSTYSR